MRRYWLRFRATAALILFSSAVLGQERVDAAPAVPESGTMCVLPNSPDPPTRISPGGAYNPTTLKVRIDQGPARSWPHKSPIKIEGLALNERHLLVLTSDGKRIQSLWFRFTDFKDTKVCVYFDGYEGVQLGDKHSALWCKCR
jgi:hypothetical protein